MVMSRPWRPAVAHMVQTAAKTTARIRSWRDMGPIFSSSRAAKAAASGVFLMTGGKMRITIHGMAAIETIPGTEPAMNQLAQVMGKPFWVAIWAAIGFEAWPVKNMAAPTQTHW